MFRVRIAGSHLHVACDTDHREGGGRSRKTQMPRPFARLAVGMKTGVQDLPESAGSLDPN
jgi:hypothetical protein